MNTLHIDKIHPGMIALILIFTALLTGCYVAPTYYLQDFRATTVLPSNTVSLTKSDNAPEIELGGSVTATNANTAAYFDSSLFIFSDPEKDTTEYNVRLANTAFAANLFAFFTSGKIFTFSFEGQFGKTGKNASYNLLIGLGARFHSPHVGGAIFTNIGFSKYDFIVSILCEDPNFVPTKYFFLNDRYTEWRPYLGWSLTINTTETLFPLGLYFNLKAQCMRLFKYETVFIDYTLLSPSVGIYKSFDRIRFISGINCNLISAGKELNFKARPCCVFQASIPLSI